jgi:hypothetical protein
MIPQIQESFSKILLPPQLKNDGDFAGNAYIDTVQNGCRWGHLRVEFLVGTVDAAIGSTAEGTAPLIEECDTTDGTYTDVTDAALGDAIGATEDDSIFAIDVGLMSEHKRYMQVQVPHAGAGTTGCNLAIAGILTKPDVTPDSATLAGLAEHIVV